MPVDNTLSEMMDVGVRAAMAAGDVLGARALSNLQVNEEEGRDVKLEADRQAEKTIRAILKDQSDYAILGEEMGYDGDYIEKDWLWIVDPLDGTANYLKNVPACCVSIALWKGLEPVLGIVYDFNSKELYRGNAREGTSEFCGVPSQVSSVTDPGKAIYATGFPVAMNLEDGSLQEFFDRIRRYRKIRMIGSAALGLAYVANGRFDAYEEEAGRLWDIAAGVALVKAAGGITSFELLDPNTFLCNVKVAASEELISE